ncbi:signal peptide protein, partial [Luteibacter rhizovicinus DSM 16549]
MTTLTHKLVALAALGLVAGAATYTPPAAAREVVEVVTVGT